MSNNLESIIDTLNIAASFVPDEHKANIHAASEELVRLAGELEAVKAIRDEDSLFRAVSEILDGCAHHPNVEPDYTVIHQTWERFTSWVRSTALLVGPANVVGEGRHDES